MYLVDLLVSTIQEERQKCLSFYLQGLSPCKVVIDHISVFFVQYVSDGKRQTGGNIALRKYSLEEDATGEAVCCYLFYHVSEFSMSYFSILLFYRG